MGYLDIEQMRGDGHLGTAFGGDLTVIRDEFRHEIHVYNRAGSRVGHCTEEQWVYWNERERTNWLADLLVAARRHPKENTQGVLNFLADIGRRWAAA